MSPNLPLVKSLNEPTTVHQRYLPSFTSVTSANWMLNCNKIKDLTTDPGAHSQEPYAESRLRHEPEAYMSPHHDNSLLAQPARFSS